MLVFQHTLPHPTNSLFSPSSIPCSALSSHLLVILCLILSSLSSIISLLISSHITLFFLSLPAMSMLNNNNSGLDLDDVQEDTHYHPLPGVTTSLTSSLPSSSLISSPSGLAIDTIAQLTHDELYLNPEFMEYIHMVDTLQELLGLWEKMSMGAFFLHFGTACHGCPVPSLYWD